MVTNKRVFGKAMSMPAGIGMGVGINMLLIIIGCAVLAKMLEASVIEVDHLGYGAMGILLLSSFAGAAMAVALVKRQRLLVCMLEGGFCFGLLLLINGLMFGGAVPGIGITGVLLFVGTGVAAMPVVWGTGKNRVMVKKWYTG